MYDSVNKNRRRFQKFVKEWILDVKDHNEYIDKLGASRLAKLRVVPGFQYAAKLVKEDK